MIDAYEIGIQLLLQDDVSAGLAVINRGLAEVDRAIAATSASLVGLVNEAERTTKAIAGAVGAKVLQTGVAEPKSAISSDNTIRPAAKEKGAAGETALVDVVRDRGADVPMSPAKASPVEDRQPAPASPSPSTVERAGEATAPAKPSTSEVEFSTQPQSVPAADFTAAPVAPVAHTTNAGLDAPWRQSGRDTAVVDAGIQQRPSASGSTMAVRAAIGKLRTPSSPAVERHRGGTQVTTRLSVERDRATAPWPNIDQPVPQSQIPRPVERATAPQSQGREHADGGGGAVMLDGRLVGQWLSEHMGRVASRPPGGTSFFDARQTPAWNVSGAL